MKKTLVTLIVLALCVVLACNAFGAQFVKSIEQKEAPTVASATYVDKNGEVHDASEILEIVIMPISETEGTTGREKVQSEELLAAVEELKEAKPNELVPTAPADAVVTDAFDVKIYYNGESIDDMESVDIESITIKFETTHPEKILNVLHRLKSGTWEDVPFTVEGNLVICTLTNFSPFAFITTPDNAGEEVYDGPDAPKTGNDFPWILAAGAVVCLATATTFFTLARKNKKTY